MIAVNKGCSLIPLLNKCLNPKSSNSVSICEMFPKYFESKALCKCAVPLLNHCLPWQWQEQLLLLWAFSTKIKSARVSPMLNCKVRKSESRALLPEPRTGTETWQRIKKGRVCDSVLGERKADCGWESCSAFSFPSAKGVSRSSYQSYLAPNVSLYKLSSSKWIKEGHLHLDKCMLGRQPCPDAFGSSPLAPAGERESVWSWRLQNQTHLMSGEHKGQIRVGGIGAEEIFPGTMTWKLHLVRSHLGESSKE